MRLAAAYQPVKGGHNMYLVEAAEPGGMAVSFDGDSIERFFGTISILAPK